MRWHAEGDDLVLCTELIKFWRSMTAMTIKDKKSVRSCCTRLCMSVKVLYLLIAKSIVCLAIITYGDCLVRRDVLIPAGLVELAREYYEWWDILS
jgi:hypothetical protein